MSPVRRAYVWSRHSLYSSSYNSPYVYFPSHVYHGRISTNAHFIALHDLPSFPFYYQSVNRTLQIISVIYPFLTNNFFQQMILQSSSSTASIICDRREAKFMTMRGCGKSTFGPQTSAVILPSSSVISTKRGHNDQCFDGRSHPVLALSENNNHYDVCPNRIISSSLSDGPRPGMPSQGREQ